jgi:hypothetical protein
MKSKCLSCLPFLLLILGWTSPAKSAEVNIVFFSAKHEKIAPYQSYRRDVVSYEYTASWSSAGMNCDGGITYEYGNIPYISIVSVYQLPSQVNPTPPLSVSGFVYTGYRDNVGGEYCLLVQVVPTTPLIWTSARRAPTW